VIVIDWLCPSWRSISVTGAEVKSREGGLGRVFAEERKQQILAALKRAPAIRAVDLGRTLGTSLASIRRDLADLERSGLLKRTHGGAISNDLVALEPSLAEKEDQYQAEKAAIGAAAASLVQPGDTIFLDAGSTTRHIARELHRHRNLTVVTNALSVASELASSDLEIILTGGQLRRGVLSQVGPIAEQAIASLHVDKLFLAANGIHLTKGITTPNIIEARTKRAMVDNAKEVFLVADHSKFGRVTLGRVCGVDRVHAVVTDAALPDRFVTAFAARGLRLHLARTSGARGAAPVLRVRRP
jgi:DeoR family transcriptional regulator, fructose operon transcriptional repressor